jgi:hypothetical protein
VSPPFRIDPARLRDVGRDGRLRRIAPPIGWLDARHRALLGWAAGAGVLVLGLAGLTVAAFALGWRRLAAGAALAMLLATPLLGAGPLLDWWKHRR